MGRLRPAALELMDRTSVRAVEAQLHMGLDDTCGAAAWGWVSSVIGRTASPASSADAAKPDSAVMATVSSNRLIVSPLIVMLRCIQAAPARAFKGVIATDAQCHCEERSDAAISHD